MSRVVLPTDPYLGKPIRSLQTMLRLLSLEDHAIPRVIPDGIYGSTTLQAVSTLQKRFRLPVTGVVNETTWQAIVNAYDKARIQQEPAEPLHIYLGPGQVIDETSPVHVLLLQAMLLTISGHYPELPKVAVSGQYDAPTRTTVRRLQQLGGLEQAQAGSVDKETWRLLTHLYRGVTTDAVSIPV